MQGIAPQLGTCGVFSASGINKYSIELYFSAE